MGGELRLGLRLLDFRDIKKVGGTDNKQPDKIV